jgi:hypothetical protein
VIPLRAGIETSEWAYERSDVAEVVTHARAPVASTWPARSGSPPEDHVGHTYLATIELDTPLRLHSAMLHTVLPEAFVRVGRVRLSDGLGGGALLTHLLGLGDHSIVYRSEDVLIYRNNDVLPRAFLIPATEARRSGAALTLPTALATADILPVQMVHYADQRVTLGSSSTEDVYLVLTDLAYPGWVVTVDGRDATLLRVDGVFRGVALSPGDHEIMFAFSPRHG